MLVLVHDSDMPPTGLLQQLVDGVFRKAGVTSLDCQEKSVIAHAAEAFPVEHRMVPARQTIHDLPCKECSERGEKYRELEHDRKKCWNGEETPWLPMDSERVEK